MAMNEPELTDRVLAREIIERCIQAEIAKEMAWKCQRILRDGVRNAIRAKSDTRRLAILEDAMSAWESML